MFGIEAVYLIRTHRVPHDLPSTYATFSLFPTLVLSQPHWCLLICLLKFISAPGSLHFPFHLECFSLGISWLSPHPSSFSLLLPPWRNISWPPPVSSFYFALLNIDHVIYVFPLLLLSKSNSILLFVCVCLSLSLSQQDQLYRGRNLNGYIYLRHWLRR